MPVEIKQTIAGYEGYFMKTEMKLFIDGVEVKKGDRLIYEDNENVVIIYSHINAFGYLVDEKEHIYELFEHFNHKKWKFYKKTKKYAPAIFVTKQNGKVIEVNLGTRLESETPAPHHNPAYPDLRTIAYWPASDYYKDGYYVLPEEG